MSKQEINLMEFGSALGREEMRKVMAGSTTCWLTCCNCQNSSCQTEVDIEECNTARYTLCGPGYPGGSGPCATCAC